MEVENVGGRHSSQDVSYSSYPREIKGTNCGSRYTILASCMHAGARIVKVQADEEGQWSMEVLAKFEEHKSMNYGSDVQPDGGEPSGQRTIISTSFYDKLLCLWRV